MSESFSKPTTGTRSVCLMCSEPIVFANPYWRHVNGTPRHPAVPDDGPKQTPMERVVGHVTNVKSQKLELLAAAFLRATGLDPTEAELVEDSRTPGVVRYYFRKREKT